MIMEVSVKIPSVEDLLGHGLRLAAVKKDCKWDASSLSEKGTSSGIYLHHNGAELLYVGKATAGRHGVFLERLRREFQEGASGNSDLFKLLFHEGNKIRTVLLDYESIKQIVIVEGVTISDSQRALILERVLIAAFRPKGNKA